jgi:hypothetical protein
MMLGKEFGWSTVELSLSWDFNVAWGFVILAISTIVFEINLQILLQLY